MGGKGFIGAPNVPNGHDVEDGEPGPGGKGGAGGRHAKSSESKGQTSYDESSERTKMANKIIERRHMDSVVEAATEESQHGKTDN